MWCKFLNNKKVRVIKIKRFKSENGVVTVIVALSIIALMMVTALTIDVGSLYEERRYLQTVADAAALAGAQQLPESPSGAEAKAIEYAEMHGVTSDNIEVDFDYTYGTLIDTIKLERNYWFLKEK